ncbi:MAG: hypothetical protein GY838_05795 [bacterium]|nr:hypothetical protein [bacterium]
MAIHWSAPDWLWPLLPIVAAGAVLWTAWVYARSRPAADPGLRRLLTGLRAAAFVLLLAAVAAPVLGVRARSGDDPELHVIIEDSASMAVADAGDGGRQTRWERARELIDALEDVLAGRDQPVALHVWRSNGLGSLEEFTPDRAPEAVGTDLDGLLAAASRRTVGRPVRSFVLVSDGQETRRNPAVGPPAGSPEAPRLFVVGVGDPAGPPDRLLADIRYPGTAHVDDEIAVHAVVDHRGGPGSLGTVNVRLEGPEGVLRDTMVTLAGQTTPLEMVFTARDEGLHVYELSVSPLDDERFQANNRASLVVDVRRGRQRVLMVADRPGWDTRFLAQAALAEPRLELTVVHRTARGLVRADSLLDWTPPQAAAGWADWDAVMLAGWDPGWPAAAWEALDAAVTDGLGLTVLAPTAPSTGVAAAPPPRTLAEMLPVTASVWRWRGGEQPVVPGDVPGHPVLAGVGRDLARLPPVRSSLPTLAAPTARTLLRIPAPGAGNAAASPLLVVGDRGSGRVGWCGAPLWQLAFGELTRADAAGGSGHRLLRNLLVWTAGGEQEAGLHFTAHEPTFSEGERIRFGAHWRDMRGRTVSEDRVSLTLRRTDGGGRRDAERTYALAPTGDGTGALAVDLPLLAAGRYEASLQGEGDGGTAGAATSFVILRRTVEDTQVRRDVRALAALARRWHGRLVADGSWPLPVEIAADLEDGDWSPGGAERRRRLDPWSGWPFLAAMALLLGAEWVLRRHHGML